MRCQEVFILNKIWKLRILYLTLWGGCGIIMLQRKQKGSIKMKEFDICNSNRRKVKCVSNSKMFGTSDDYKLTIGN